MVFSSVVFLFRFLPAFMICYFLAPGRMRNFILLLGSLFFYAWGEPVYVLLMLFSTVVDYGNGLLIERWRGQRRAAVPLVVSVVVNLGVLGFFKYGDFLVSTVNSVFGTRIPLLRLGLPIGISFYTFQTMSYTIDVYRGQAKVQKNLLDFGVYVTMFPQLIAGPIVKYRDVEDCLHSRRTDVTAVSRGIRRFCAGLAKKVLLANNLGELWNQVMDGGFQEMSMLTAWLGILGFAFQIYFDFSGYSDMAIGLGEILGFHFPENFNYPYLSGSVTEFWRRWHISLGSWFREYVYIPERAAKTVAPHPDCVDAYGDLARRRVEFCAVGALVCVSADPGKIVFAQGAVLASQGGGSDLYLWGGAGGMGAVCHSLLHGAGQLSGGYGGNGRPSGREWAVSWQGVSGFACDRRSGIHALAAQGRFQTGTV